MPESRLDKMWEALAMEAFSPTKKPFEVEHDEMASTSTTGCDPLGPLTVKKLIAIKKELDAACPPDHCKQVKPYELVRYMPGYVRDRTGFLHTEAF